MIVNGSAKRVLRVDPACYQRHLIHTQDRNWAETNCYVDVWVELLHAWGLEPIAALPFTVTIDFEGDQWTFFKFPHGDLRELYGLDVQELAIWRPLTVHLEEQIDLGRPLLIELDSYYLPDTLGTAYQHEHVKTTVAAIEIDVLDKRFGYFHGQGYYDLQGDDFDNVFHIAGPTDSARLAPYVEFVKRRSLGSLKDEALVQASIGLLQRQLTLLPEANPFDKFKARFAADLDWLTSANLEVFHQYSFATLRQFGACFELAATYLKWLAANEVSDLEPSIAGFTTISNGAKTLQFHLARAIARKKTLELSAIDEMASAWCNATDHLKTRLLQGAAET